MHDGDVLHEPPAREFFAASMSLHNPRAVQFRAIAGRQGDVWVTGSQMVLDVIRAQNSSAAEVDAGIYTAQTACFHFCRHR